MQEITIKSDPIPVKAYTKAFIENGNLIKPYILKSLHALFVRKKGATSQEVFVLETYPVQVMLMLPYKVFERKGDKLTPEGVVKFNDIMEGYIKDRFECELEANIRRSLKDETRFMIKEMIQDLCVSFGFTEFDLPFETIKKSLKRYCDKESIDLEDIKNFVKIVPKKTPLIRNNPNYIRSDEYRQLMGGICDDTLTNMRKRNEVTVVREGRWLFVDLTRSKLPVGYSLQQ